MKRKNGNFPKGVQKVLLTLMMMFVVQFGLQAAEHFNKKIVEVFTEELGSTTYHYAGIDEDGDGFADVFLRVPHITNDPFFRRIAGFLKEGATVSYEDRERELATRLGIETIHYNGILEINGRSILQIFPDGQVDFPYEAARQARNTSLLDTKNNTALAYSKKHKNLFCR